MVPAALEVENGVNLESSVALALLREMHLLEDTTGSRMALHYLRDLDDHGVDFLILFVSRPVLLAEVKASDDPFANAP